jgi:hypothetical protein
MVGTATTESDSNSTVFPRKFLGLAGKRYLLFRQEPSIVSPEGTTFSVFLRPAQPYTASLISRLQDPSETDDELWLWAKNEARAHAGTPKENCGAF